MILSRVFCEGCFKLIPIYYVSDKNSPGLLDETRPLQMELAPQRAQTYKGGWIGLSEGKYAKTVDNF